MEIGLNERASRADAGLQPGAPLNVGDQIQIGLGCRPAGRRIAGTFTQARRPHRAPVSSGLRSASVNVPAKSAVAAVALLAS